MKYIELFWNRLYYCIFNCDKKTQTLLNRFFECLFYYLKFYRNRKGNNTRIPHNETLGICVSDYIMIGFTCLLIWTLFNLVSILFPCVSLLPLGKTAFILVSVVPCLFINYFFFLICLLVCFYCSVVIEYKTLLIACTIWCIFVGISVDNIQ